MVLKRETQLHRNGVSDCLSFCHVCLSRVYISYSVRLFLHRFVCLAVCLSIIGYRNGRLEDGYKKEAVIISVRYIKFEDLRADYAFESHCWKHGIMPKIMLNWVIQNDSVKDPLGSLSPRPSPPPTTTLPPPPHFYHQLVKLARYNRLTKFRT